MRDHDDPGYARRLWDETVGSAKTGTRKIADLPKTCNHPKHCPPMHQVFSNGVYEHVCPGCGAVQHFTVANPTY